MKNIQRITQNYEMNVITYLRHARSGKRRDAGEDAAMNRFLRQKTWRGYERARHGLRHVFCWRHVFYHDVTPGVTRSFIAASSSCVIQSRIIDWERRDAGKRRGYRRPLRPLQLYSWCLRPYHAESTPSRPIWHVKQRRAQLVLGLETAWEPWVL